MYYIYCDESCHLQNDESDIMILGAMTCPRSKKKKIFEQIRNIKIKHGLTSWTEIKWTNVSPSKLDFFEDLIDYYINNNDLNFRAIVAKHKKEVSIELFGNEGYDGFYYRMYYYLLDLLIDQRSNYNILLDYKDTHGGKKIRKLHKVLSNKMYDFDRKIIKNISLINSRDSEILQLTDLLIGAIGFYNRGFYDEAWRSSAKKQVVKKLINNYGEDCIKKGTSPYEKKFNVFIWKPRGYR